MLLVGARACLAAGQTAMRKGFDGLALLVQEVLKRDPHGGHLFVFRGRRGGLIKVLWNDGQGMCLFSKRLERRRFLWPVPADGVVTITPAQLGYLTTQSCSQRWALSDDLHHGVRAVCTAATSGWLTWSCAAEIVVLMHRDPCAGKASSRIPRDRQN
jgi:transposase